MRRISSKLFASALVALGLISASLLHSCQNGNNATQKTADGSELIQTIMTRTSIRSFTDQPVDDATVEKILRAGMSAPTAVNKQPWAFVVVNDREQMERLRAVHPYAQMLKTAQFAIVVCGDMSRALQGFAQAYWIQDASAATENILLAAHSLGLGAVWCGVYPKPDVLPKVKEVLEMPSHIIPLNIIPIGYPAESPAPKDKWKPENIHYNRG
ncbi:MAG: nitroreductase family protein [Bacteroidaceae bacterium]|nr:nitroreductase family protein [Bacteroidaceae bacterium]